MKPQSQNQSEGISAVDGEIERLKAIIKQDKLKMLDLVQDLKKESKENGELRREVVDLTSAKKQAECEIMKQNAEIAAMKIQIEQYESIRCEGEKFVDGLHDEIKTVKNELENQTEKMKDMQHLIDKQRREIKESHLDENELKRILHSLRFDLREKDAIISELERGSFQKVQPIRNEVYGRGTGRRGRGRRARGRNKPSRKPKRGRRV